MQTEKKMKIKIPNKSKQDWLLMLLKVSPDSCIKGGEYYYSREFNIRLISMLLGEEDCIFTVRNISGENDLEVEFFKVGEMVKVISKSAGYPKPIGITRKGYGIIQKISSGFTITVVIDDDFYLPKDLKTYD